jgi:predicted house-cleaning noncanonical NTP pyrophosphatase (MazG superfamily)
MKLVVHNKDVDSLFEEVYRWGLDTFPESTIEGRNEKVLEEIHEYIKDQSIEEMADIIITAIGKFGGASLYRAIIDKHSINQSRTWRKTECGNYRHETK